MGSCRSYVWRKDVTFMGKHKEFLRGGRTALALYPDYGVGY